MRGREVEHHREVRERGARRRRNGRRSGDESHPPERREKERTRRTRITDGEQKRDEEERCGNERKGTGGEGTRAGMSRLLVSQTRGRYFADQWQSTRETKRFSWDRNLDCAIDSLLKDTLRIKI